MQAEIRALLEQHCTNLPEEVRDLADRLGWLADEQADIVDTRLVVDAIAQVHRIKGSTGSIGFGAISAVARNLETILRRIQEHQAYDAETRREVGMLLDDLAARASQMRPEDSRLYFADFSSFKPLD